MVEDFGRRRGLKVLEHKVGLKIGYRLHLYSSLGSLRASSCMTLELVKRAESFHAVEFFGFPIHGVFEDGEAVAGSLQQDLLRRWMEIPRRAIAQLDGDFAGAGHERIGRRSVGKLGALGFDAKIRQLLEAGVL